MNPFKVLNIDQKASKSEIIQAVAVAMRERKYTAQDLASAQKMLFDPVSKAVNEFLHFIDLNTLKQQTDLKSSDSKAQESISLKRLDIFDEKN